MHIERVCLQNFGLFKDYTVELTQGLVGIFGANGCGKTTLVNGIFASLTNDFSRFAGVKADQIHDMAGPREQSFVEVHAVHNDQRFYVRRSLRPNGSELKIHGEKAITKAPEIEARLQNDLGVDTRLIGNYVFVDQWRMFDFLELTPAKRAEAFKWLCRTEKADVIHQACAALMATTTASQEVVDNSDELTARLGELDTQVEQLTAQRASQVKRQLNSKSLKSANAIVRKHTRHETYAEGLPGAETDVAKWKNRLKKRQLLLKNAKQAASVLGKTVAAGESDVSAARVALGVFEQFDQRRQRRSELETALADLRKEAETHAVPDAPQDLGSKSHYSVFIFAASQDLKKAQEVIDGYAKIKSGTCPTCGQAIDERFVLRMRKEAERCQNVLSDLRPKLKAIDDYETASRKWETWRSGWTARRKATGNELDSLRDLKEPKGDRDTLLELVKQHEEREAELEEAAFKVTGVEQRYERAKAKLEAAQARVANLVKYMAMTEVSDEILAKVERRLKQHEEASLKIAEIDGQLKEIGARRKDTVEALDTLRAVLRRRKKVERARKILARVQDVFHWSHLPWRVAQGNLIRMEGDINNALAAFGDPFWVQADDKLSFQVHIPGRTPKAAEALSGGQKGVLAIAFRSGANAVFNIDLGMMFLDEPTAGLDKDNVGYFSEALVKLANEVRGKRQLVIVTHADDLRSAFDQVIDVGAAA